MKRSFLSHAVGVSLLTLSLATVPFAMSASAQTNTDPNGTGTYQDTTPGLETVQDQNTDAGVGATTYDTDNDTDWGWLGLLGLTGLLGLMGRKRHQETVTYREREPEREIYR